MLVHGKNLFNLHNLKRRVDRFDWCRAINPKKNYYPGNEYESELFFHWSVFFSSSTLTDVFVVIFFAFFLFGSRIYSVIFMHIQLQNYNASICRNKNRDWKLKIMLSISCASFARCFSSHSLISIDWILFFLFSFRIISLYWIQNWFRWFRIFEANKFKYSQNFTVFFAFFFYHVNYKSLWNFSNLLQTKSRGGKKILANVSSRSKFAPFNTVICCCLPLIPQ